MAVWLQFEMSVTDGTKNHQFFEKSDSFKKLSVLK
jgi:hypothetical protein